MAERKTPKTNRLGYPIVEVEDVYPGPSGDLAAYLSCGDRLDAPNRSVRTLGCPICYFRAKTDADLDALYPALESLSLRTDVPAEEANSARVALAAIDYVRTERKIRAEVRLVWRVTEPTAIEGDEGGDLYLVGLVGEGDAEEVVFDASDNPLEEDSPAERARYEIYALRDLVETPREDWGLR